MTNRAPGHPRRPPAGARPADADMRGSFAVIASRRGRPDPTTRRRSSWNVRLGPLEPWPRPNRRRRTRRPDVAGGASRSNRPPAWPKPTGPCRCRHASTRAASTSHRRRPCSVPPSANCRLEQGHPSCRSPSPSSRPSPRSTPWAPTRCSPTCPARKSCCAPLATGIVSDDHGVLDLDVRRRFADVPSPNVMVIPGGQITHRMIRDGDPVIDWIRTASPHADWTTSVCSSPGDVRDIVGATGVQT